MPLLAYSKVETILDSLKFYIKANLRDSQKIIRTVKAGLIDERDELPMITILPILETSNIGFNNGLFSVDRTFRIDIIDKAFKIEDIRESLKRKVIALNKLFTTETLGWNLLDSNGQIQCFDFELDRERLGEPASVDNFYTQFATIPLTLRSYLQIDNTQIPTDILEVSLIELLDYLFAEAKTQFPVFETRWRDIVKPASMENFPALGIFIQEPNDDKLARTSTTFEDVIIIYRIYSSLATREVAFLNHLRNIEKVKQWIYERPCLDGRVDYFKITSIDYGIDSFRKPFQGNEQEYPVFRSDITTTCSLIDFKYA